MTRLTCTICHVAVEAEDDFEAGMFAVWHMLDEHPKSKPEDFKVTHINDSLEVDDQWFLEPARQTLH